MFILPYTFLALAGYAFCSPLYGKRSMIYDFEKVPITPTLKWTPCYNNFTCVNLQVPLDYDDHNAGSTNVAFIRWESPIQPSKGDIIVNPGGPGGSGVAMVLKSLPRLNRDLGTSYNIVGMDPRGVNNSGIQLNCFKDKATRNDFDAKLRATYKLGSPSMMAQYFEAAGTFGDLCAKILDKNARYANTPAAAQDMLYYTELNAETHGRPKKNEKLNFYGASYGSTLGMTFASLFPDRVGRMILDGIADIEGYYSGSPQLSQADETVKVLFTSCFEAGSRCSFYRNDISPDAIKKRFEAVLYDTERVGTLPLLREYLFEAAYNPRRRFLVIIGRFVQLEQFNARRKSGMTRPPRKIPHSVLEYQGSAYSIGDAIGPLKCTDADGRNNISTVQLMEASIDKTRRMSAYFGEMQATTLIPTLCRKWPFSPPESQKWHGLNKTYTASPILFATSKIDPITPCAKKMAPFFLGSVVLKQNSVGHGTWSEKSKCTTEAFKRFMDSGRVPPPHTTCEAEPMRIFGERY